MQPLKPGSEKTADFTGGVFGCRAKRIEHIHDRGADEDTVYALGRLHHGRAEDAFVRMSGMT
jgi:hypothetical protein